MAYLEDNAGLFYVFDGIVREWTAPMFVDMENSKVIYEVIRIIDKVPLFFEDHFLRMARSLAALGMRLEMGEGGLIGCIKLLLKSNSEYFCNIKIMVFEADGVQKTLLSLVSHYPSEAEINNGVPVGLLQIERNDPNVKMLHMSYKEAVNKKMREGGFFEVLLVNNEGCITQGGKSNVFFVIKDRIFYRTGNCVLKGVTRKYVFEACEAAGFEVIETSVATSRLDLVEGAFLSGTSIKALPISLIEDRPFCPPTIRP